MRKSGILLILVLGGVSVGWLFAADVEHVTVYAEPNKFAGWPANNGMWAWGNEILVGFMLGDIHPEGLQEAIVRNEELTVGSGAYRYLVMPQVEILSTAELERIKQFEAAGGTVLWVGSKPVMGVYAREDDQVQKGVAGTEVISKADLPGFIDRPFSEEFVLDFEYDRQAVSIARFRRAGQCLYYLVNRGEKPVRIPVCSEERMPAELWDPFTGAISKRDPLKNLEINSLGSLLIMHPLLENK